MDFVSFSFVGLYLVAILLRITIGRNGHTKPYIASLLVLSAIFYTWHIPAYYLLLASIVLLHFFSAIIIENVLSRQKSAKAPLIISIVTNIAVLAVFKYADLILNTLIRPAMEFVSGDTPLPADLRIALPVAISFYTFQTLSYTLDVYRKKIPAERDFISFFFYISFFPQLIAGPIVRAWEFIYQMARIRRPNMKVFLWGSYLIIRGFFLKLVIADNLGVFVDEFWNDLSHPEIPTYISLCVPFLFSIQLLCDFMAYTDIARGISYHLGFRLPINFNAPYIASTFTDFWKRWHITLSRWFKDYIYISLGGNRHGFTITMLNICVVFVISGLWHGANVTFLVWGGILGMALVLERAVVIFWQHYSQTLHGIFETKTLKFIAPIFWYLVVQAVWITSLIFFRSDDVSEAFKILENILSSSPNVITGQEKYQNVITGLLITLPVLLSHLRIFLSERRMIPPAFMLERFTYAGVMLALTITLYASPHSFIYFRF